MSSLCFSEGLYLFIKECPVAPRPLPLESGFSIGVAYRVLGLHNPSETSEAYFIMANDRDEIWFISNRHTRFYQLNSKLTASKILMNADEKKVSGEKEPRGFSYVASAQTRP